MPGIAWVLAFTIAAEIGDIDRFATAKKLVGYSGLCPKVNQSGDRDRRGPLSKHGPKYLRWAMLEATMHALRHPAYSDRDQQRERDGCFPRMQERGGAELRAGGCLVVVRGGSDRSAAETPARLRKRSERRALSGIGSGRASGCRS